MNSPSSAKPRRDATLAGMNDFVQAIRLENNHLDEEMLNALKER